MCIKRIIEKLIFLLGLPFLYVFFAYLMLFTAFMMVANDAHTISFSEADFSINSASDYFS